MAKTEIKQVRGANEHPEDQKVIFGHSVYKESIIPYSTRILLRFGA